MKLSLLVVEILKFGLKYVFFNYTEIFAQIL